MRPLKIKLICESDAKFKNGDPDVFAHNLDIVMNEFFYLFHGWAPSIQDAPILSRIRIGDLIGSGVHGKVFRLSGGMMIKFFEDGVGGIDSELRRMRKIVDDVFGGKKSAPRGHMHFFDCGKVFSHAGAPNLFYAIMPEIIPFDQSQIYKIDREFFDYLFGRVIDLVEFSDSYASFYYDVMADIEDEGYQDKARIYRSVIRSVVRAAYIAKYRWGGSDFHEGNLGYFPQQPDKYFFFDM